MNQLSFQSSIQNRRDILRKALIFPGYPYSCEKGRYSEVLQIYRDEGFEAEPAEIEWDRDLEENLRRADQILEAFTANLDEGDELHLFGHSWGAVCALWAARNYKTDSLVLASLSPEFEEDVRQYPKWGRTFGHLMRAFMGLFGKPGNPESRPRLEELKGKELGEIILLYGQKEYSGYNSIRYLGFGHYVSANRLRSIPNSSEKVVEGAGHMLNDSYVEQIAQTVATID